LEPTLDLGVDGKDMPDRLSSLDGWVDKFIACGICDKACKTNVIACDDCDKWIHKSCLGITTDELDNIGNSDNA
jgi:hypothetical protein